MKAKEFIKQLKESGYREFNDRFKHSDKALQRRFKDKRGVKYFITVYFYDKMVFGNGQIKNESFEFDLQFIKMYKGKEFTINMNVFGMYDWINNEHEFCDLKLIEELVEDFFIKNRFEYYELNN